VGSRIIIEENYLSSRRSFLFSISSSTSRKQQGEGASYQVSIFMSTSESVKMYFCKESNKLVGASNYLA